MENLLFLKSIQVAQFYLSIMGLTFYPLNIKFKLHYIKRTIFIIHITCQIFFLIAVSIFICSPEERAKINELELMEVFTAVLYIVDSLSKTLAIFIQQQKISNILTELNDLFSNTERKEIKENFSFRTNRIEKLTYFYAISNVILSMSKSIGPLIESALARFNGKIPNTKLPHYFWHPFKTSTPGVFPMLYLFNLISLSYSVIDKSAIDILFCTITSHICKHFQILQYDIENFQFKNSNSGKKIVHNFIQKHTQLIKLSEAISMSYSIPMLINFVYSTIAMCISGFTIVFTDSTPQLLTYMFLFISTSIQIFIICWHGNDLVICVSYEIK